MTFVTTFWFQAGIPARTLPPVKGRTGAKSWGIASHLSTFTRLMLRLHALTFCHIGFDNLQI